MSLGRLRHLRKLGCGGRKKNETKVLVHSQRHLVDAAQKRGIDVQGLVNGGLPLYQSVLKKVQRWMEEWENKMSIVEQLAHAEFLLQGAHKEGVNIREISADPLT